MSSYSSITGAINYYTLNNPDKIDQIKDFLESKIFINDVNRQIRSSFIHVKRADSILSNYSYVNDHCITIHASDDKAYYLKQELTSLVNFLTEIGVRGITINITSTDDYGDVQQFSLDGSGNVVCRDSRK